MEDYVPTRFVSENLGYNYLWVKSSSTAKITKTLTLLVGDAELAYNGTLYDVVYHNEPIDTTQMPSFSYHGVVLSRAKKVPCEIVFIRGRCGLICPSGNALVIYEFWNSRSDSCAVCWKQTECY